jgi:hypothetical protein
MRAFIIVMAVLAAAPAMGQPRVTNGEVRQAATDGTLTRASLDALAKRSGTAWLAYAVPLLAGDRQICDGSFHNGSVAARGAGQSPVMMLEGPRRLWVLYRLEAGRIDRIRIASEDCTLDAGGLTVHWLDGVTGAQSVAVLATFLEPADSRRIADGALVALAMHTEPAALDRLITTARTGATTHARGQALFWLAQRAGEKAIGTISDAIANDPETDVKRRAVFALSQLPKDEGVPRLIEVARTNTNPAVRKQAMFWLGQTKDPRALKFFEDILLK